jgi:phosphatidylethanolamine/phosphatidyl-N-methylethanolamine N-methyltransferase
MAHSTKLHDALYFLKEAITNPGMIGAVAPSSRQLARAMVSWLPAANHDYILELGPGTGIVTEAILERGVPENRLVAIEKSTELAALLGRRYPRAHIICGDALDVAGLLRQWVPLVRQFPVVISSLPLLNFEPGHANDLTRAIQRLLAPNGKMIQFSYHLGTWKARTMPNLKYLTSRVVWFNIPPARVSVYQP